MQFKPTFFMKNKHIQTLYSSFFRKRKILEYVIEKFTLSDGDFLDIYWHKTVLSQINTPIVILFHGLTGSFRSPYIQGVMEELTKKGFHTVLMHFRGCAKELNSLPRSYHSGETGDALEFIHSLQIRFPKSSLYGVGYSLGGNMLLKLLGETKEKSPFKACVSVSAPLELDTCADAINQGFSLYYQEHLMKGLRKALRKKYQKHEMESLIQFKEENIASLKTFWDFDGTYTAPIHGFDSAQDYYSKCSSKQFLKDIHTPTLLIHAVDDPFMNDSIIPTADEVSSNVSLEISKNGGHVGFIEGSFFSPSYWLEKRITSFICEEKEK